MNNQKQSDLNTSQGQSVRIKTRTSTQRKPVTNLVDDQIDKITRMFNSQEPRPYRDRKKDKRGYS